jgi:hypothetical protein
LDSTAVGTSESFMRYQRIVPSAIDADARRYAESFALKGGCEISFQRKLAWSETERHVTRSISLCSHIGVKCEAANATSYNNIRREKNIRLFDLTQFRNHVY